jgi:uncharacterized protein
MIDQTLVGTIVDRILSASQPERIILFGSAAAGTMTRDSDLDLLVIGEDAADGRDASRRLRSALSDLGTPADVFAMTPERFEETKGVIGGLAYPANKYGKVIYEAA